MQNHSNKVLDQIRVLQTINVYYVKLENKRDDKILDNSVDLKTQINS